MDNNSLIQAALAHPTPVVIGLLVLILAEEFVANSSLFASNSIGQMIVSYVNGLLVSLFKSKTDSK